MELTSWWQVNKVTLNVSLLWLDCVVHPSVVNSKRLLIHVHDYDLVNVPVGCGCPIGICHLCNSQGDSVKVVLNPHIFTQFVILRGSIVNIQVAWSGLVEAFAANHRENFKADIVVDSLVNRHTVELVVKDRNDGSGFHESSIFGITNNKSLSRVTCDADKLLGKEEVPVACWWKVNLLSINSVHSDWCWFRLTDFRSNKDVVTPHKLSGYTKSVGISWKLVPKRSHDLISKLCGNPELGVKVMHKGVSLVDCLADNILNALRLVPWFSGGKVVNLSRFLWRDVVVSTEE